MGTTPEFTPLSLDKCDEYIERYVQCPQKASDYSFANIWGWAEEYGLEWSWGPTCVWIRQTLPEVRYWAPVGPWDKVDWTQCAYIQKPKVFIRVPEQLALMWKDVVGDRLTMEEERGHWDYLYSVEGLTTLKGNKYHRKKNHVNQFKKKYDWEFLPITPDCIEETIEMQDQWCAWRECDESEALIAENSAIDRVLTNWDLMPNLLGGTVRVEGKIIAYTVAEPLGDNSVVIHFEKARTDFRGAYQAINQIFLEHMGQDFTYVNREQDLGDEGLRKAKLSYNPVDFLKKYRIVVNS